MSIGYAERHLHSVALELFKSSHSFVVVQTWGLHVFVFVQLPEVTINFVLGIFWITVAPRALALSTHEQPMREAE